MIKIVSAQDGKALEQLIRLAQDYVAWMIAEIENHYPELDIAEFKAEHSYDDISKKFPGEHIPLKGCLLIAMDGDALAGCIALGQLSETIGEVRTLFVRPSMRGKGVAKELVRQVIQQAKELGYDYLRLDTLSFMGAAYKLYQSFGFYEIDAYLELSSSLKQHIRFLEVKLESV